MIVVASKPGQLGNRLYLFAHFIAWARESGVRVSNPSFDEYAGYFEATRHDALCRYPARKPFAGGSAAARRLIYHACFYAARLLARSPVRLKSLRAVAIDWEERVDLCDPAFLAEVSGRRLTFVQGWQFRAPSLMGRHADAIREFFRPLEEYEANVAALVERARRGGDVLVGVHIRRGDYKNFMGGQYFYEPETYAEVLAKVEALFPGRRVVFLVCSDERLKQETFSGFESVAGTGHLVEDMYALAACDYIVGPPSTYTLWASFYGATPLCMIRRADQAFALDNFAVNTMDNMT